MIRNKISNLIKNRDSGFTIVELLIVIVVIGILAAITIVSYTGITAQATMAKYKQDASSIVNVAEIVYNTSSAYPVAVGDFTNTTASLPAGVAVDATMLTAAPTAAAAEPVESGGVTTYQWWGCAGGVNVYYSDGTTLSTLKAGAGCS